MADPKHKLAMCRNAKVLLVVMKYFYTRLASLDYRDVTILGVYPIIIRKKLQMRGNEL